LLTTAEILGEFRRGVILPLRTEGQGISGLLLIEDDRVAEAYSADEVILLEELALKASVVVENSRQHRELQGRDRLAVLGRMAAGLAHEVKNPLGAIQGAAQLLSDAPRRVSDDNEREFISIILEEVDRLDRVVGSVLNYARPARASVGPVDVGKVVARTAKILEAESPECALTTRIAADLPTVRVDAEQLRQVLINLIRNAVQAMSGRGEVVISAQVASANRAEPTSLTHAWVVIAVADHGPGIAPEVRQNLFVPFVTTKERGSGLGLAISQRIVEEMTGRIEVESQPGRGTTFSVFLPVDSAERSAVALEAAALTSEL
jgi:signal transduction histidine kinase